MSKGEGGQDQFRTLHFRGHLSPQSMKKNALYNLMCIFNTTKLFA